MMEKLAKTRPRHAAKFRLPRLPVWARGAYAVLALAMMAAAGTSVGLGYPAFAAGDAPSAASAASQAPAETIALYADTSTPAPTPPPDATAELSTEYPMPAATLPPLFSPGASTPPALTPAPTPTVQPLPSPTPKPTPDPKGSTLILRVYKGSQCVVALRQKGKLEWAVRIMICSTGARSSLTPNGTFKISDKYAYHQLEGAMGQYACRFNGGVMFHSVPIDNSAKTPVKGHSRMNIRYYNQLGRQASLGCVRLLVRDAQWIYAACPAGTRVEVVSGKSPYGSGSKPGLKSGSPYMNSGGRYGWDPTDPDPRNPYLYGRKNEANSLTKK